MNWTETERTARAVAGSIPSVPDVTAPAYVRLAGSASFGQSQGGPRHGGTRPGLRHHHRSRGQLPLRRQWDAAPADARLVGRARAEAVDRLTRVPPGLRS